MPLTFTQQSVQRKLLKELSRSFYLTLRILPSSLRAPIGLAYLLAKAVDTIIDSDLIPVQRRAKYLLEFKSVLSTRSGSQSILEINQEFQHKSHQENERTLLNCLPELFSILDSKSLNDQRRIRSLLTILCRGMEMDLNFCLENDTEQRVIFRDWTELDRYTYYVAGCVGEFWTEMLIAHTTSANEWDINEMTGFGIRFGKALQLTNILRDVSADLAVGRCYLPQSELSKINLTINDLLNPALGWKSRSIMIKAVTVALDHYVFAEKYLLRIPRKSVRLRLATLWPILIGLGTLAKISATGDWIDSSAPPRKVTRKWVYLMLIGSPIAVFSDKLLGIWISKLRKRVELNLDVSNQPACG